MPGIQQARQVVRITSPLPADALALSSLKGHERLSTLFSYSLECVSEEPALDLYSMLGQNITVEIDVDGGNKRFFNGVVASAAHVGNRGDYTLYSLDMKPWLWLLTHTTDCRVFSYLSVPEIVQRIFQDNGFDDVDNRLTENYPQRNYCVQYQESDFAFVSRLMEHEGIYYFFEHENGKTILILCDNLSAHRAVEGYEEIPVCPAENAAQSEQDHLVEWSFKRHVNSAKYVMNDFGFKDPSADMLVSATTRVSDAWAEYEQYEYPGAYSNTDGGQLDREYGERLVQRRMERELSLHEVSSGHGTVKGLNAGHLFHLTNCERDDQNREYLVLGAKLDINLESYYSNTAHNALVCNASFECIFSQQRFRPEKRTTKPLIQGPQTALVTGPAGEEIWTDEYGRVKLQFHWDRYGTSDENSSRWVRVSQAWAGKQWGAIHIPRVGEEVIVEFLDGNPDRPIVTGRVYNGDRPVPYDLPANATQSGIKSHSSKGGSPSNFNEIRMDDKKGSEEFYVQAEKNYNLLVKNDRSDAIGNDYSLNVRNSKNETIGNDKSESIARNKTANVGGDHQEDIGENMTISVGANLSETVEINHAKTVGVAMQLSIGTEFLESVGTTKQQNIGQNKTEQIGKNKSVSIKGNKSENVGGSKSVTVNTDLGEKISGDHKESVSRDYSLTAKKVSIMAKDEIVLSTGKASITMKSDGTITIDGNDITVKGNGKFDIKGDSNISDKKRKKVN